MPLGTVFRDIENMELSLFQRIIRWAYVKYVLMPVFEDFKCPRMEFEDKEAQAMHEKEVASRVCRTDH